MKKPVRQHIFGATIVAVLLHGALLWGLVVAQKPPMPQNYADLDPFIVPVIEPFNYVRNNFKAYPKELPFKIRRSKSKPSYYILPVPEALLADEDKNRNEDNRSPPTPSEATAETANPDQNGHLRGRSALQQALQFRKSCVDWQMAGEYPDEACSMPSLSGNYKGLGADPRREERFRQDMRDKEFEDTYKRSAGSPDYWKRVNRSPSNYRELGEEAPAGSYSDPKDQRTHSNGIPIRP